MILICRLCLKEAPGGVSIYYTDDSGVSTSSLVKTLVPELYLGLSVNPVVCYKCYTHLRQSYIFRLQCLRSENLIGIYIRETKHTENTIVLDDVVEYWVKHYKNKPQEIRENLKEWFGKLNDRLEEPIILNQTASTSNLTENLSCSRLDIFPEELNPGIHRQKDVLFELQEKNTVSESLSGEEVDPIAKVTLNDCFPMSEIQTKDKGTEKTLSNTTVGSTIQTEEFSTKTGLHSSQNPPKPPAKIVSPSIPSNPTHRILPVRTYRRKPKIAEEVPDKTDPEVSSTGALEIVKRRINLIPYNLDDEDLSNLVEELQKDENLKKLGFSDSDSNMEETYILKKFIDKADNLVSFALVPYLESSEKTEPDVNLRTGNDMRQSSVDAILLNAMNNRFKLSAAPDKKDNESEQDNVIRVNIEESEQGIEDTILEDDSDPTRNGESENLQNNCEKLSEKKGVHIKVRKLNATHGMKPYDDRFEGINMDDSTVPENVKNNSPNGSIPPDQATDEESLGLITFPPAPKKAKQTTDPPGPIPQVQPMPLIRVRPVSALQKVRTLNHELWPQKPSCGATDSGFEAPQNVYKAPTKLVENISNLRPIVLNSKLSDRTASTSVESTKDVFKPRIIKTYVRKPVPIRPLHKHLNPITVGKDRLNKLRKIEPFSLGVGPRTAATRLDVDSAQRNVVYSTSLVTSVDSLGPHKVGDRRRRGDVGGEEVIDIKEEPLDYTESDMLDMVNFASDDHGSQNSTESEGESTRSASETSFMDTVQAQNDVLKSIVATIPEVEDDPFDEPEYVHINNVSFSDLAKLVDESKKHREKMQKKRTRSPELGLPRISPARFKTEITRIIRNDEQEFHNQIPPGVTFMENTITEVSPVQRTSRYGRRSGKRLRLVQVDAKGMEIEDVKSRTGRRRINRRSLLRSNVESAPLCPEEPSVDDDRNVCVLYTNFTSEGDYINDHDYLINPYMRNKMHYYRRNSPVCVCLLCDLIHHATDHVNHMKIHETKCKLCQIDFHNVFILNLHVRCHSSFCNECNQTVSYAYQIPHAQLHNKSLTLSNVDLGDIGECLGQPDEKSQQEKEPPSGGKGFKILKELLDAPIEDKDFMLSSSTMSNVSPRRSTRITRSRKVELEEPNVDDDEEACIYDKTTKSFITPTIEKQQKLLEKCSSSNVDSGHYRALEFRPMRNTVTDVVQKPSSSGVQHSVSNIVTKNSKKKRKPRRTLTGRKERRIKRYQKFLQRQRAFSEGMTEPKEDRKDTSAIIDVSTDKGEEEKVENGRTKDTDNNSMLFCDENIDDEPEPSNITTLLSSRKENLGEASEVSAPTSDKTDTESKKVNKVIKKRKRIFTVRSKKQDKILSISQNVPMNNEETESTESPNLDANDSSKSDLFDVTTDVSREDVRESKKEEEKPVLQHATSNDGSLEEPKSISPSRKSTRLREAVKSKPDIFNTHSRPDRKRKRDAVSPDLCETWSIEKERETIVVNNEEQHFSDTGEIKESSEKKTNKNIHRSPEHFKRASLIAQSDSADTKSVKGGGKKSEELQEPENDSLKTEWPVSSNSDSIKSNTAKNVRKKLFVPIAPATSVSPRTTSENYYMETSRSDKIKKKSAKTAQAVKSPLRGDLKLRIKSIKYNPFVLMANASKTRPKVLKTYGRASRKRKGATGNVEVGNTTQLVEEEGDTIAAKFQKSEMSESVVDLREETEKIPNEKIDENLELKVDDTKTDLTPDPFSNTGKARSSRSRGSLGLVEGLKGYERRGSGGYKTHKKPKKAAVEGESRVDLDSSQSKNVDLGEATPLKNVESNEVSVTDSATSPAKNVESSESVTVGLPFSQSENVRPDDSSSIVE